MGFKDMLNKVKNNVKVTNEEIDQEGTSIDVAAIFGAAKTLKNVYDAKKGEKKDESSDK
ncbi:MAG: hypothetical protein K5637_01185 [Lachnospiraceae bacterium]|nr:hypothetical protein [Lachnospiraceae bacterium]